ncbi:MAG: substrate-binding domain-containing protein [Candidatus Bathyarchaeota archaeon]|nr:substrate-binding domain-containing protein [Candidatus Bathyarchaeota archaeon]
MERSIKTSITLMLVAIIAAVIIHEYHASSHKSVVVLVTTTSTYDSGLLNYLIPVFEEKHGIEVRVISTGSGRAIEIAKRGDADLILIHSRRLELEFIDSGSGIHRVGVMYNDFIVIGPLEDPADIGGLENVTEAFRRIALKGAEGKAMFISRADRSGTHMLELSIWRRLGVAPSGRVQAWYMEAGAGMGAVLRMANEMGAYTLTDRATWLSFKKELARLRVLVQGDAMLLNPYAIILVNPEKHPHRNYKGALALAKWILSEEGQNLIANFRREGEIMFYPMAGDFNKARELGFPDQDEEIAWYDLQNP